MADIDSLRTQIDAVDEQVLELVAQRQAVVRQIGAWKKEHQLAALQPERYEQKRATWLTRAHALGIADDVAAELWETLHTASVEEQNKIITQ